MNGFDVRALGWVVTRDVCVEMARTAFGGRPRMSPAMLRELRDRWCVVQSSLQADRCSGPNMSVIVPLAMPLSKASETAIAEFIDQLTARFPELYGEAALRSRWLNGCAAIIAGATVSAVLGSFAPSDIAIIRDATLVMLVFTGWKSITTIQLWRTHRLVDRILQHHVGRLKTGGQARM
jgi:hypothetical protein